MYLLSFLDIDIHFMENYGNFVFQWYKKQDYQHFMNVLYRCSSYYFIFFILQIKVNSDEQNIP